MLAFTTLGADGILKVAGTSAADTVTLVVAGSDIVVTLNGQSETRPLASVVSTNINTGAGNDRIWLGNVGQFPVKSYVDAGDGNDSIISGMGNDTLVGGAGNDTYQFFNNWGKDIVREAPASGTDTADFNQVTTSLLVSIGTFNVVSGVNTVGHGGNHIENVVGGTAVDVFTFSKGSKLNGVINGGANLENVLDYRSYVTPVTVDFTKHAATGTAGVYNVTNATGGWGNDKFVGDDYANVFNGMYGADTIIGNGGTDSLSGGQGGDSIAGGAGDDTLVGGSENDTLAGNGGMNTIDGGTGYDIRVLTADAGIDTGILGSDPPIQMEEKRIDCSGRSDALMTLIGTGGIEVRRLNDFTGAALLQATGLDYTRIIGSKGNDTFIVLPFFSPTAMFSGTLDGGAGTNTLDFAYFTDQVFNAGIQVNMPGNAAALKNVGGSYFAFGITNITKALGSAYGDLLIGDDKNNVLDGRDGNDTIRGNGGNDTLTGGNGFDLLYGDAGNDRFFAADKQTDEVWGGGGTDTLTCDQSGDRIYQVESIIRQ